MSKWLLCEVCQGSGVNALRIRLYLDMRLYSVVRFVTQIVVSFGATALANSSWSAA